MLHEAFGKYAPDAIDTRGNRVDEKYFQSFEEDGELLRVANGDVITSDVLSDVSLRVRYDGKPLNLRRNDWSIMKTLKRLFVNDKLIADMRKIVNSP